MKKILIMLFVISVISGCACSYEEPQGTNQPADNNVTNEVKDTVSSWYSDFETALEENNYKYTSKEKLDASLVNGAEGYRYISDNGNIDIYRYENGNNFDQIMRDKRLTIDGKEKQVEVNGNYVIVSDGVDDNVLDIFRNMK